MFKKWSSKSPNKKEYDHDSALQTSELTQNIKPSTEGKINSHLSGEDTVTDKVNPKQNKSLKEGILSVVTTLIMALIIIIPFRMYVGKPFLVNGSSMDPSFESWDYLLVDVFTYQFLHEPKRGDVVVFKAPVANGKYFIKRIIGLPNETVELKNGKVIIYNDKFKTGFELKEPYVAPYNRAYNNLKMTLGDDEYFVMGDNRAGSYDSRFWGPLKREDIVGRPIVRLFPFGEIGIWPAEVKFKN